MIVREQAMMLLVPKFVDTPPFLYFLGSLRVLIGLAIVLAHNMWIGTLGDGHICGWFAHDFAWYCHARASRRNGAENSSGLFTWQRLVHNSDRRDRAWRLARLRRIHHVISCTLAAQHPAQRPRHKAQPPAHRCGTSGRKRHCRGQSLARRTRAPNPLRRACHRARAPRSARSAAGQADNGMLAVKG